MAFRPLTEAECGQKNPLLRLTSHVTRDHTFSENHGHLFPNSSDQLVEQFLQETRAVPQSFRMDDLMREMHEIESQRSTLPPVPASTVKDHIHDDAWARQYIDDGKVFHDNANNEAIWAEISSQENNMQPHLIDNWPLSSQEAVAGPSSIQQDARALTLAVDDPKFVYSKFMKFMGQVAEGDINLEEGKLTEQEAANWGQEFLLNNNETEDPIFTENWAKASTKAGPDQYWENFQEEWMKNVSIDESELWASEFEQLHINPYKEYMFNEDNPMFDIINPLERGKQLLEEGDIPSAVLCFESAVQKESENAEAWLYLGKTQAVNEQDPKAIPALIKCLELEPTNLAAHMALAISYTNESYYSQAAKSLMNWLSNHPKYKDLVPPDFKLSGQVTSLINPDEQKVVQDLFIKAALRQPNDIDYEVQCGLGVLFNVSGECEKAADCFRAAITAKPNDAKLWNRLGASLANGCKSAEAVEAYHNALSLEPGFIRARYNVGITCINLQSYREAAEHFLTVLNQQAQGRDALNTGKVSQMSDSTWSALRMCLSLMNRPDLRQAVDNKNLQKLNEEFKIVDS